ncbi:DUF2913 family protein [Klebsiella pneumoniae]|uniref:DUF2913 family protein n=1 Tax=Klebsiella pneumoniae TaxID=573 RepID=UPI001869B987|nr:DUF2913 family protein [Klebsiella pneumoniae]
MTNSSNPISDELSHLSWCIIIAVKLARQEGRIMTPSHEHMFIMQWLANAQKYKLFPKLFAPDILWFLDIGKRYGQKANLYKKAEAVLATQSLESEQRSALFRFTQFFEELKKSGWGGYVLPDRNFNIHQNIRGIASAIYVSQSALAESFNDRGEIVKPLEFRVEGNFMQVQSLLNKFQFNAQSSTDVEGFTAFRLVPD